MDLKFKTKTPWVKILNHVDRSPDIKNPNPARKIKIPKAKKILDPGDHQ